MTNKLLILPLLGAAMLLAAFERTTGQQKSPPRRSVQRIVQQNLTKDLEDDEDGARQLFLLGDEAVTPLIKLLSGPNKEKRASAAKALAYIGNAQGMHALRNAVQSERDKEAKSVMSFFLAGGLVATTSESDLNFLRSSIETARSADDDDETAMPALSAALTLGMMGGSDSLPLLRKVAKDDNIGVEEIGKAIRWIETKSIRQTTARTSSSEEVLVKSIVLDGTFFAEEERKETSVTEVTFNRERNRVLVSLEIYLGPKSARGYDLVLSKRNGEWKVVGIWFAWVA
jgi:hypothetical protein